MSEGLNTARWSVTTKISERDEIAEYTARTGVSRNELMRRATLAYIRKQASKVKAGNQKPIEELFQEVGPIDLD